MHNLDEYFKVVDKPINTRFEGHGRRQHLMCFNMQVGNLIDCY